MKNVLLVVCGALLMAMIQAAPQLSLESLDARVTALEKRVLGDGPTAPAPAADEWVMVVEKVEPIPADAPELARVEKLRADADAADVEAAALDRRAAEVHDKAQATARAKKIKFVEPKETGMLEDQAKDARARAKDLRSQALRLEKDLVSPRHRIIGWNGERTTVLTTDKDLSGPISRIAAGRFITWRGKRSSMAGDEEHFTISTFKECEPPANFRVRPK